MNAIEILRRTHNLISGTHWIQGTMRADDDFWVGKERYCLVGAVRKAAGSSPITQSVSRYPKEYYRAIAALDKVVSGRVDYHNSLKDTDRHENHVINFNDDATRTRDDIIDVINRAIKVLREDAEI